MKTVKKVIDSSDKPEFGRLNKIRINIDSQQKMGVTFQILLFLLCMYAFFNFNDFNYDETTIDILYIVKKLLPIVVLIYSANHSISNWKRRQSTLAFLILSLR